LIAISALLCDLNLELARTSNRREGAFVILLTHLAMSSGSEGSKTHQVFRPRQIRGEEAPRVSHFYDRTFYTVPRAPFSMKILNASGFKSPGPRRVHRTVGVPTLLFSGRNSNAALQAFSYFLPQELTLTH